VNSLRNERIRCRNLGEQSQREIIFVIRADSNCESGFRPQALNPSVGPHCEDGPSSRVQRTAVSGSAWG
jgi:hypothetical protein